MERLRHPTIPILGESGRGLFARACGNHNIPHAWMILQQVGATFRNRVDLSESDDIDLDALGYILKVDPTELRARTYPLVSNRRRSFFGVELSDHSFETRMRRFSPAALRDSSHTRALWEIRDLPYCVEGWDLLQTHCRCGVKQGWTRMTKVDCCDGCGRPLAERVEPVLVPVAYQEALSLPALLLSPLPDHQDRARATLPNKIARRERSAICETIIAVSKALTRGVKATEWERVEAVHVASKAVLSWPMGIDDVARPDGISRKHWGHLVAKYESLGSRGVTRSSAHGPKLKLVGIRKAVAIGRASREVLLKAREAGLLTEHSVRLSGRGHFDAFDVAELKRFAKDYSGRLSIPALAKAMGLPLYAAEQIVATGRLPTNGISLAGEERFVSEADYAAFIQQLVDAQSKIPAKGDVVPLRLASQAIGGQLKPWGKIFVTLLDAKIRFVLTSGEAPLMHRISIRADDVAEIRSLAVDTRDSVDLPTSTTIHKQDALEILNIGGDTPVLVGLRFAQGRAKLYELQTVLERAAKSITLPEIAQRTGWSISKAFHEMRRGGVPLLFEGCWCRKRAERLFSPAEG
jgi:hypothetical protein